MLQILAVRRHRRRGGSASSGFPWRRSGPIRTIRGRPGRLLRRLVCASTGNAGQARIECAILCPIEESHPMERKKASDYPQELLNLFDCYVHGEIDRRNFLEGAKKYAVGGVTATAIWRNAQTTPRFTSVVLCHVHDLSYVVGIVRKLAINCLHDTQWFLSDGHGAVEVAID